MRTTVDIDTPVLQDLKRLQKKEGKTLSQVVKIHPPTESSTMMPTSGAACPNDTSISFPPCRSAQRRFSISRDSRPCELVT